MGYGLIERDSKTMHIDDDQMTVKFSYDTYSKTICLHNYINDEKRKQNKFEQYCFVNISFAFLDRF